MRQLAAVLGIILIIARQAGAQSGQPFDSVSHGHGSWLVGASVGLPGYGGQTVPELFTVGLNATQIKPGRLGADFALGTMPRALGNGAGVLGARAGGVLPFALTPDLLLLPSAGLSVIGAAGGGGGVALAGINAGMAAVLWTGPVGIRTGITWHHFEDSRGAIWLIELGVVHGI
jgi:hypothetical protein